MESLATSSLPDLSQLPDGRLNYGFLWCRTRLINEISRVLHSVRAWPAVAFRSDRHGLEFAMGDVSFGRLKWSGQLEVSFPRETRDRLIAERMIKCSLDERCADRIDWVVRNLEDVDRAVWLLRLGYLSLVEKSTLERAVGVPGIDP
jgi:hypothetical protein